MSARRRKVCVVLTDRANYGRLKPVMSAIAARPELELQVLCAGTMVLERFASPVESVKRDGFPVHGQIASELEGSTPLTMAKSLGAGVMEFATELSRLAPDLVVLIGDRYGSLSAALAAAYLNLCILHIQGGEVSGSIDESARHCITKLSHFHFPATRRAADFLVRMGERRETILGIGCPSSDMVKRLERAVDAASVNAQLAGGQLDLARPFLVVLFHPVTTEYGGEREQMRAVLDAVAEVGPQALVLWPNVDAGADHISEIIRQKRASHAGLLTLTNVAPELYLALLARCACAVGNSSSFVREASLLGTPVVLVGNRQESRERDVHAVQVAPVRGEIVSAVKTQVAHGPFAPSDLYGDGDVCRRIVEGIVALEPYVQKRLAYVDELPPIR